MPRNYSFYMLGVFLGIGSLIGLAFPFVLQLFTVIPAEDRSVLHLLAIATGLLIGVAIFLVNHSFNRYVIGHFREVLARVQEEDYSARVEFSGRNILGMLADDVNATLGHLEEKNDEVQHDDLTGLPNRQFLKQHYRKHKDRLAEERTAFLFFDLDKFKEINDQFGHLYGDQMLIKAAERINSSLAENEFLVRLSGDEFLLVAKLSENCSGKDIAEQLMSLFVAPLEIHGTFLQAQMSIGISMAPVHGIGLGELIRKADFAMYEAKKTEGSSYYLFEERLEMEALEVAESL